MPTIQQEHPEKHVLAAFIQGRLSESEMATIERHVADCADCCDFLSKSPEDQLAVLARDTHEAAQPTLLIGQGDTNSLQPGRAKDTSPQAAAEPSEIRVPRELAEHPRYRVQKLIGKGGMGVVYKAEHRMMQRPVALKVINQRFISNKEAIDRFHQEVRAAAKLSHPNIVAAFDAEQAGNLHFLVMEYVDGKSLAQLVQQRGPLSVVQACNAIRQVCQGLQHAHERGMIHRDIKPQNLMLAKSGKIKILDFGLARFEREQIAVSPTAPTESELTAFGTLLGTPDYMAPEQATDARLADNRADIFSLGCTLFFLLTGRSPFEAGSFTAMINKGITREMMSLKSLRNDLPAELVQVFERMTAAKPANRFATVADVAEALTPFGRGEKFESSDSDQRAGKSDASLSQQDSAEWSETDESDDEPQEAVRSRSRSRRAAAVTEIETDVEPDDDVEEYQSRRRSQSRRRVPQPVSVRIERLVRQWWKHIAAAVAVLVLLNVISQGLGRGRNGSSEQAQTENVPPVWPNSPSSQNSLNSVQPFVPSVANVASSGTRQATGAKVLMVLPAWSFWWPDYGPARTQLEAAGIQVTVASWQPVAHPLKEGGGESVRVDLLLDVVSPADYDALMICGGPGVNAMIDEQNGDFGATQRLAKTMHSMNRVVSAVCMGPIVLVKAGLVEGMPVTGSNYIREKCRNTFGVTLSDQLVEQHNNIITGRDADAIPEFTAALITTLAKRRS